MEAGVRSAEIQQQQHLVIVVPFGNITAVGPDKIRRCAALECSDMDKSVSIIDAESASASTPQTTLTRLRLAQVPPAPTTQV